MGALLNAVLTSILISSGGYDWSASHMQTLPTEAQFAQAMLAMTTNYRSPTERERYYTDETMARYSGAVFGALRDAGKLEPGYLALVAGTLDQQTRFQHDSVSQWNRDSDGRRIIVPRDVAWKKPDRRLDYGIYQFNYGTGMRYGRELFGDDFALADLRDPAVSLAMAVHHIGDQEAFCQTIGGSRDAKSCAPYLRGRKYCKKPDCPLTCRCLMVKQCTGIRHGTKNGNPSSLCEHVDKYWRAIERVMLETQTDKT